MDTPWIDRITAGYDDPREARVRMQARQPNNRLVRPEEIAAAAAYLASDEAVFVVGVVMVVDGGMTARCAAVFEAAGRVLDFQILPRRTRCL